MLVGLMVLPGFAKLLSCAIGRRKPLDSGAPAQNLTLYFNRQFAIGVGLNELLDST